MYDSSNMREFRVSVCCQCPLLIPQRYQLYICFSLHEKMDVPVRECEKCQLRETHSLRVRVVSLLIT